MTLPSTIPIGHSIFDPTALAVELIQAYPVPPLLRCAFWSGAMNDIYLVEGGTDRYFLRVTRPYWRTLSEIPYELALLQFLTQHGLSVAQPVLRRDGQPLTLLHAPEGVRGSVLFTVAHGRPLALDGADSWHFGRAIATLHTIADAFTSRYPRHTLDLETLLATPLRVLHAHAPTHTAGWAEVEGAAQWVREGIAVLSERGLDYGVCHGDAYHGNAHIDETGTIALFDFDCCGIGWRAYDLAVFRSTVDLLGAPHTVWDAFLAGYQEQRPLRPMDLAAIPLLVAARRIWHMGVQVQHSRVWGLAWFEGYVQRAVPNLSRWMDRCRDGLE